ncbi:cartilage-associated protein-like [Battus philenor]|uniref:cartilage-associated protein-like n=1 Tax=Battus philenor TaxID=42288 RepID=UPI0035D10135
MLGLRLSFAVLLFICINIFCVALKFSSIEKIYKKGVDAYAGERWSECISKFEESMHLFKLYRSILINCNLKCNSQPWISEVEEIEDLKIFAKFLITRLCVTKCQDDGFKEAHLDNLVSESTKHNMKFKKPFEYLHICYFQMNALPKAANAAYTYLVANPNDTKMKKNLEYYINQPEVDINEVIDLDSEDYMMLYKRGLQEYYFKKWAETVANMEEALTDYLSWENMCRAECQHQSELEWSHEFTVTVTNYMMALLMCKQNCQEELKLLHFNSGNEFLADILNYLQISYYNLGRVEDAAKSVETYLLLMPKNEEMLSNKMIYSTLTEKNNFVNRSDITYYFKRDKYEKHILNVFYKLEFSNENL